jgi:hypothetical protein
MSYHQLLGQACSGALSLGAPNVTYVTAARPRLSPSCHLPPTPAAPLLYGLRAVCHYVPCTHQLRRDGIRAAVTVKESTLWSLLCAYAARLSIPATQDIAPPTSPGPHQRPIQMPGAAHVHMRLEACCAGALQCVTQRHAHVSNWNSSWPALILNGTVTLCGYSGRFYTPLPPPLDVPSPLHRTATSWNCFTCDTHMVMVYALNSWCGMGCGQQ